MLPLSKKLKLSSFSHRREIDMMNATGKDDNYTLDLGQEAEKQWDHNDKQYEQLRRA